MQRQLYVGIVSAMLLMPVAYLSWQQPIAVLNAAQEDDCPLTSATGFELSSVVRVSPTKVACEYGRGRWF
jgi:hypothetical protein